MNSVNTNIGSLIAKKNMETVESNMQQAMERLSSGLRINSAADDAAGSAITSRMEASVRSLGQAIRNSQDAISMTQTAEGAVDSSASKKADAGDQSLDIDPSEYCKVSDLDTDVVFFKTAHKRSYGI